MIIAGSFWRKVVVTAVAAVGFVSLYEVTMLDSKDATLGGTASATSACRRRRRDAAVASPRPRTARV